MTDWITDFLDHTSSVTSPEIFRRWAAITTISAAMERRVWSEVPRPAYPNLFVTLVGRPGVGKTEAIYEAQLIGKASGAMRVAPTDITREGFIDFIGDESGRRRIVQDGETLEYHPGFICAHELGNFIKEHDLAMLALLQAFYDCRDPNFEDIRRSRGATLAEKIQRIPNPMCAILAGTTPGHLGSTFPPEAWSHGFLARMILVYSGEVVEPDLFVEVQRNKETSRSLRERLAAIGNLHGKFSYTPEAQDLLRAWVKSKYYPIPQHHRLSNYSTRRLLQVLKLSMIMAVAARPLVEVEAEHVQSAFDVLFAAEDVMPYIFTEMVGRSDTQIIADAWNFVWGRQQAKRDKPWHKATLMMFLNDRCAPHMHEKIIQSMEAGNMIQRLAGTEMYRAQPKDLHGTGGRA